MSATMIDIRGLIELANGLAPLPASAVRLAELIADPDCNLEQVVELIAFDQALTLKLLRAANSVASASATHVGSVHEAVIRMGTAQVLAFTVAAGARPLLQPRIPAYGLAEGALWRHSVAAAVATESMQGPGGFELPPETFAAALLHDVGKLIMGRFLTPEILGFIRWAQEMDHLDRLEAESVLLEVNHAELGGLVAQHWRLPPRIVHGITYHHNPGQGFDPICDFTHLANQIAKQVEARLDGRKFEMAIAPDVAERLSLAPERVEALSALAFSRYGQVSRRYNAG
jgi:HD-like signal output (HDOD) protein